MSRYDLLTYGESLDVEYDTVSSKHKKFKFTGGIPYALASFKSIDHFDLTLKEKSNNDYDTDHDQNNKKASEFKQNTPGRNCKNIYEMCLNEILKHDIDIFSIEKKIDAFYNRGVSSLCGNTDVFTFYCGKNNYKFEIVYTDDCDCFPGILYVKKIKNINNNQITDVSCDLFCQNTSDAELENFLILINNINFDDYIQVRFGHFLKLPALLIDHGFTVTHPEKLILDNSTKINSYDFHFYVHVKTEKGECLVIPYKKYKTKNYKLYICPTLEMINMLNKNKSYYHEYEKIDVNTFNMNMRDRSFELKYDNSDDFNNLVVAINKFIDFNNETYGFQENGIYYNDKFIENHYNRNNKIQIIKSKREYDSIDFEIAMIFTSCDSHSVALTKSRMTDIPYPYDYYCIYFCYDKNIDSNNCKVTIQGKYHDLTKVANDYYSDKQSFISKYTYDIKNVAEKVTIFGSYMECFSVIDKLINEMTEMTETTNY